ncbi:MAG: formate dehydrogenase accessory protein FdhE [Nitrospirota bacterium]
MKERTNVIRERKPAYTQLLDFYQRIHAEQESARQNLHVPPVDFRTSSKKREFQEGFPLLKKEDFPVDIPSSVTLFGRLREIGRNASEKLRLNVNAIEQAAERKALDIPILIARHFDTAFIDHLSGRAGIDSAVLEFLLHMSILPSLQSTAGQAGDFPDLKNWLKGYCPLCGSLPLISFLKEDGQRFLLCSFCSFSWPSERLRCPFCENSDHSTLHYFFAEGEEAYRVDICDKCRKYIKTVDIRKLGYDPDLNMEDITSAHLDIIAAGQGFARAVSTPWLPGNSS